MEQARIAIIDDEPISGRELKRSLNKENYDVEVFFDGVSALKRFSQVSFDVVLCDLKLPVMNGLEVLREIKIHHPRTEVIIMTGFGSVDTAVEAIQAGAFHYLKKPLKSAEARSLIRRACEKTRLLKEKETLKQALFSQFRPFDIIGQSPPMQEIYNLINKVSQLDCNVLIQGESGTGKELIARSIHARGPRTNKPFVSFNCGGFTEELISNELFGHEKGAYTGAAEMKIGLMEIGNNGTVFLDEIGEMPISMQVKLLRFVQERNFMRVGGVKSISVDVRIIAASNKDLMEEVKEKNFREDLYYRLNVVPIQLPPLRKRKDDIPLLIKHFLEKYNLAFSKEVMGLEPEAMEILEHYPYPGNVRELENIIERVVALAEKQYVSRRDLPSDLQKLSMKSMGTHSLMTLEEKEKEYIQEVLFQTGYNKGLAAQVLDIPRTTLWRKLKRLGLA